MKLNSKLLLIYAIVAVVLLVVVGFYAEVRLRDETFQSVYQSFIGQLYQVDFALTSFLVEVEYDVLDLVGNELVRTRDDGEFTQFLDADEATFEYHIGETEQAIIDVFNTYRLGHPYANSVYMGRENGSFVRSHPRARPTQYDPRERPWYQLAVQSPDQVMRTAPYRSVTTPDVNIGTVKALIDEGGQVYGVVGIDITLRNLTDYISEISVGQDSYIVLLDDNGVVLTGEDEEAWFKTYQEAGLDYFEKAMDSSEGYTQFQAEDGRRDLFYYTSPALGWKIGAVVPEEVVDSQVRGFVNRILLLLVLSLSLLGILTVVGVRRFIVGPVSRLQRSAENIIRTGNLDQQIVVESRDEIGQLAASFNAMVGSIRIAAEELRASEEKYRSLVENINVGVFRSTPEGRLVHANTAAIQILGYESLGELGDFSLERLYERPEDRADLLQRLESGESIHNHELRFLKADGTPTWVSLSVSAQYDEMGRFRWLQGVIEDITARRKAEDALRRARDELERRVAERTAELSATNVVLQRYADDLRARNSELDAFAHTVAHDLKNPVAALVGFAEALDQDPDSIPPEVVHKLLRTIARSGRKIGTIVDELLLLSSVREMDEIDIQPLDMPTIVAEVQRRLLHVIEQWGGEIVQPSSWPVVVGHGPWVEEVWANYISNALKYGGRPPRVELGYDRQDGGAMIRFWVRDNGPGLSPEEQASLFAPFERLHQVRTEGHGLGLSIVRRIVTKLGGEVGVDSDGQPGQGSTFYFTLPSAP